jgi:peptidoglycan/LPS O-acetylase OafA/YrhL
MTGSDLTFGTVAVDGFFLLSGFLIVKSWDRNPSLANFLKNRVLRIVPGYLVAAILSTLVVGILAPGISHFFLHFGQPFLVTTTLLSSPITPPVLPGSYYPLVNGSLWTITYEFRCYLLVAILGICGLIRKPIYWLIVTVLFAIAFVVPSVNAQLIWPKHHVLFGDPSQVFRLLSAYFVGGCFYLFRDHIPFRRGLALLALCLILIASRLSPILFEMGIMSCGGYVMFYAARFVQVPSVFRKIPDISYGIYLYGWPVEALWIWYRHGSPWVAFVASTAVCLLLGSLSWHFIESPMLKLKSVGKIKVGLKSGEEKAILF